MIPACPICGCIRVLAFRATLLSKYDVGYYWCESCGLLQTEAPYWLDEAYSDAIVDIDTDVVARNLWCARRVAALLFFLFESNDKYLDVAGGYGLLTRLLRDIGFNSYWSDRYCKNIFARGFEAETVGGPFPIVTAFEVLEHVEDPVGFLQRVMAENEADTIFFTTELFADRPPAPERWSYYAFPSGQHISFFQKRTLMEISKLLGARLYTTGRFHVITRRHINALGFKIFAGRLAVLIELFVRTKMRSRTNDDRAIIEATRTLNPDRDSP